MATNYFKRDEFFDWLTTVAINSKGSHYSEGSAQNYCTYLAYLMMDRELNEAETRNLKHALALYQEFLATLQ